MGAEQNSSIARSAWVSQGTLVANRLRNQLITRAIAEEQTLFVPISRGGLLLLPGLLATFPLAQFAVINCDRDSGVIAAMHLPASPLKMCVVVDAVIASGATVTQAIHYLRSRIQPEELWVAGISCTNEAMQALESTCGNIVCLIEDELSDGAPTVDLCGVDAGDLFQGFSPNSNDNPGALFTIAAGEAPEQHRRSHIHAAVTSIVAKFTPGRLLDFGCGDGVLTRCLAEVAGQVVGFDPDRTSVDAANASHEALNLRFVGAEGLAQEELFDIVNLCMVLNATVDAEATANNAASYAVHHGKLLWTILHPAFSYDESINHARREFEDGSASAEIRLGNGYLDCHQYSKTRGGEVIVNYHRPLAWYFALAKKLGFAFVDFVEPAPMGRGRIGLPRVAVLVWEKS